MVVSEALESTLALRCSLCVLGEAVASTLPDLEKRAALPGVPLAPPRIGVEAGEAESPRPVKSRRAALRCSSAAILSRTEGTTTELPRSVSVEWER